MKEGAREKKIKVFKKSTCVCYLCLGKSPALSQEQPCPVSGMYLSFSADIYKGHGNWMLTAVQDMQSTFALILYSPRKLVVII